MVLTHNTKRKRKEVAGTNLLHDEIPKKIKVQAQRKFAQGSNVSSPVLTPVEELDVPTDRKDVLPEPIELVPMKRPNTEDFLTFLCFRGTPVLPPNLSFFNNPRNDRASIGSSSNSSSNGSIATIPFSSIAQSPQSRRPMALQPPSSICSIMRPSPSNPGFSGTDAHGGGGRPFVAFGVRKRADPVLVSRHMDRKRRHAIALHALRRRYQEQRQAKLRALTVSKLSADKGGGNLGGGGWGGSSQRETSKDIKEASRELSSKNAQSSEVSTSSATTNISSKRKPANILAKLRPIVSKVHTRGNCATPHRKPPLRIIKQRNQPCTTPIATDATSTKAVKQKMCLRSFRGRFVQRELSVVKIPTQQRQRRIASAQHKKQHQKQTAKSEGKVQERGRKQQHQIVRRKEEEVDDEDDDDDDDDEKSNEDSDDEPLKRRKPVRKQVIAKTGTSKGIVELRLTRSSKLNVKPNFTGTLTTKRQTLQRRLITKNTKNVLKSKLRQRRTSKETCSPEMLPRKLGLRGTTNMEVAKQKILPRRVVRRMVLNSEVIPIKNKKITQKIVKKTVEGVKKNYTSKESKELPETASKVNESLSNFESNSKKSLDVAKKSTEITLLSKDIINKPTINKDKANNKSVITRNEAGKVLKSTEKVLDKYIKAVLKEELSSIVTRNTDKADKNKQILRVDIKNSKVEKLLEQSKEKITVVEKAETAKVIKEKSKAKEKLDITTKKKTEDKEKLQITGKLKVETKDNLDKHDIIEKKPEKILNNTLNIKDKVDYKRDHIIEKQDTNLKLKPEITEKEKLLSVKDTLDVKDKLEAAKGSNSRKQVQQQSPQLLVEVRKEILVVPKEKELPKGINAETSKNKICTESVVKASEAKISKEITLINRLLSDNLEKVKELNNGEVNKDCVTGKPNLPKGVQEIVKLLPKKIEPVQLSVKQTSKLLNKKLPKQFPDTKLIPEPIPKYNFSVTTANENVKSIIPSKTIEAIDNLILKVVEPHSIISPIVKVEKLVEVNKSTLSPKCEVEVKEIVKFETKSSIDRVITEVVEKDSKLKSNISFLQSKLSQNENQNTMDLSQSNKLKIEESVTLLQKSNVKSENILTQTDSLGKQDKPIDKIPKKESFENTPSNSSADNKNKKCEEKEKPCQDKKMNKTAVGPSVSSRDIKLNSISSKEEVPNKKSTPRRRLPKDKVADHNVTQRPTRKTKEAAALYMEILNHKLENDDDNESIDSFPELPNVKKMFQREHELKTAQAKTKTSKNSIPKDIGTKPKDANSDSSDDCLIKYKIMKTNEKTPSRASKSQETIEKRATRNRSPKLYTSFTDTDESVDNIIEIKPKQTAIKRFSESVAKKQSKNNVSNTVVDFSDSDEEPLANLKSTKEPSSTVTVEITAEMPSPTYGKPKRECTKRPQNYLTIFSSSDDEERYFHTKKPEITITALPKKESTTPVEVLTSKDIGRRFGKGKVNMSTEQIEKWLNDSALAGMSVRKENDEMLKFGEKIPTTVQNPVTLAESLKSDIVTITGPLKDKPETPVKSSEATICSNSKQSSAERKSIFRKKLEILTTEISPQKVNAFSVQNESSVYAFEPEPEISVSTPFRRPTRRPSSTTTSKSEDENKLIIIDEALLSLSATKYQFRHPSENITPAKTKTSMSMYPPKVATAKTDKTCAKPTDKNVLSKGPAKMFQKNSVDRLSETSEDWKYKVPSSPSAASSSSSAKLYKKSAESRYASVKGSSLLKASATVADFPSINAEKAAMVNAPVFYPTEKEFQDPLEYIEKVRAQAERFGICKIVPPANFRPECKIADEMRFTAYNQYVGKMLRRWGPSFKELMAIRRYMRTQGISLKPPPLIGGIEVDLPRLYQTVQTLGGLKEVIEKKKWPKVSELMKIPKSAQDRVTKLDDIYCKYLLPYDTLSPAEREKLFDDVETRWAKCESKALLKAQKAIMDETDDVTDEADADDSDEEEEEEEWEDDEVEECIVKGKNMALNAFFRIARNTLAMWFKNAEPSTTEVEDEFWRIVRQRQHHVCVHSGSIDCGGSGGWPGGIGGGGGYGFATGKSAACARHPANLKVLTNSSGSVLRSMGPIMGLTVPTLHVGMVFSACCWYRDPHRLPWVEYLHTGATKVWYAVPGAQSARFQAAVNTHMPHYCRNKSLWLPVDTAMLPPELLTTSDCSLSRLVQEPGQFVVVFQEAFTSNVCTGYVVSESVFWAPSRWLSQSAQAVFHELRANREPSVFSYERLVLSIATDQRASVHTLKEVVEPVQAIHDREHAERGRLVNVLGVREDKDKLPLPDMRGRRKRGGRGAGKQQGHRGQGAAPPPQHWAEEEEGEYECYVCRANLYVSMVADTKESVVFCLAHAIRRIEQSRLQAANCRLLYTYTVPELDALCGHLQALIDLKLQRKQPLHKTGYTGAGKFTGLPTLLNR